MKPVEKIIFITLIVISITAVPAFSLQSGQQLLSNGTSAFKSGKYSESLSIFRDVVIDPNLKEYHSDAYFWIAKAYLALKQLDNAEENLEFFIINFPNNKYYQEALYQKGRLMYMQNDYENCIQENYSFIENYPSSPFTANAYFWIAESLYSLGKLEEAESVYSEIIYRFPTSYKVESANYRLAVIEQKYREETLIELLKLTHEEYLKSIEEFQIREKTYEKALDSYQKKLSMIDAGSTELSGQTLSVELLDLQTTLRNKENEIMALKRKIAELEYRLNNAESKLTEANNRVIEVNPEEEEKTIEVEPEKSPAEQVQLSTEDKLKLLEIKSRALEIKSYYLKYLGSLGE